MATEAVIGKNFTFQVLFLDEMNDPVVANNPIINIFYYDIQGVRQNLVTNAALSPAVPAEAGRYIYVYSIPLNLMDGDNIHAEMQGTDPGTGLRMITEMVVVAISPSRGSGGLGGLRSRFIK